MRQSTPYEFRDSEEIVQRLSEKKDELGRWFDKRIHSLDKIARCGVGSNTFRAFRRMPYKPSVVFRDWASAEFQNHKAVSELVSVNTQREYDQWATGFSGRLSQIWQRQMRVVMPYGSSRKLPNLLLKFFVLWDNFLVFRCSAGLYFIPESDNSPIYENTLKRRVSHVRK